MGLRPRMNDKPLAVLDSQRATHLKVDSGTMSSPENIPKTAKGSVIQSFRASQILPQNSLISPPRLYSPQILRFVTVHLYSTRPAHSSKRPEEKCPSSNTMSSNNQSSNRVRR